ncbi:MAG: DUF1612 domain-containing protein [Mesorhizobium sp.]|nr:MAG: DUF1612 domain-containing protein [Mesorhizobium sp.]
MDCFTPLIGNGRRTQNLETGDQALEILQFSPFRRFRNPAEMAPVVWLGTLLVAAALRQRRKTTIHLFALNTGLRVVARERRRHGNRSARFLAFLEAVAEAAALGIKEHDRLAMAREQMLRRTRERRGNSKLPRLIDFVLSRPLVSGAMIEKELKVTARGALKLIGELGLREITGRGGYRACGIV